MEKNGESRTESADKQYANERAIKITFRAKNSSNFLPHNGNPRTLFFQVHGVVAF